MTKKSPTTLQVITDRDYDPETLISPRELLEVVYPNNKGMSLAAHKMFHVLMEELGPNVADDKMHSMELSELWNLWHLSVEKTIEIARELVSTTIVYRRKDSTAVGALLSYVERDHDAEQGSLKFQLGPIVLEILRESNHWAMLKRKVVLSFRSTYSLRLYEYMALRKGLKHKNSERLTLDELRERLAVPDGQLKAWVHIRQKALDKAIAEVNQLSGFKINYEPYKRGRAVAGIVLTWTIDDDEGRAETAKELDRHSAGRTARRHDAVEQIVEPAFPASGSIEFSKTWGDIARKHGGGLDLDLLADRFRGWCVYKGISLNQKGISKTFESFCKAN